MRTPRFIQSHVDGSSDERAAAQAALLATPASVAPKFLYDRLGSRLFEAITELPEYYPTRTEAAVFERHAAALADCIGSSTDTGDRGSRRRGIDGSSSGITLIDLGAGNCAKATRLFPLLEPLRYVAVDISVEFLHDALRRVQREHPSTDIVGLGLDFSRTLELPAGIVEGRPIFFYPGSSIGNFTPSEAAAFLRRVREQAHGGGLVIGVDLVKPVPILEAAYDDALGVTAAFNLNLLRHLNQVLDSDFSPAEWRHVAFFDAARSRIEMHLEARRNLTVRWPGAERVFRAGDRIHTENSCKYTVEGFADLLHQAGFAATRHWTDPKGWFAVFWAAAD